MNIVKLLALSLLLVFTIAARGQDISKQFCKHIEDSVVRTLNPTEVSRNEVYSKECNFEFMIVNEVDVSLTIIKYDTEEESHKFLQGWLYDVNFRPGFESIKKIPL